MKSKTLFPMLLLAISMSINASEPIMIYRTFGNYVSDETETYQLIKFKGKYLYLTTDDGEKLKLEKKQLFGYKDENSYKYRFYDNDIYRVEDISDKIIVYSKNVDYTVFVNANTPITQQAEFIYYSKNLNESILKLNRKNLVTSYAKENKFLEQINALKNVKERVSKTNRFRIAEL